MLVQQDQPLVAAWRSQWRDQPAPGGELFGPGRRQFGRGGGGDDAVVGRAGGPAGVAVGFVHLDAAGTQLGQRRRRLLRPCVTCAPIAASTAACQPQPVPISSTRAPGFSASSSVISATMKGCEIVCPWPIGSGRFS